MRALVYTAPRRVMLQDCPRPRGAEGEVEIAVTAAGICGSDITGFLGQSRRRTPPMVLGHELVGRTAGGRRVVVNPLFSCGRCTACLGGRQNLCSSLRLLGMDGIAGCFAEYVSIPEDHVYEIAEQTTDMCALLAEPLANIVHLFRIAEPFCIRRMGIVGAGTMGSMALLLAQRLGVREVHVLDVSEARLRNARTMGATQAVDLSTEDGRAEACQAAGEGYDVVLDASNSSAGRQAAFDLCRPGGLAVLLGLSKERTEIDFAASIRKEHRVAMSFGFTPVDFERSLALVQSGEIDLTPWTAEMPIEAGQRAFEQMTDSRGHTLKMVLRVH